MEAVDLLMMLHRHARHTVIGLWFECGAMPSLWAEQLPHGPA
jgi:hypothetical protein